MTKQEAIEQVKNLISEKAGQWHSNPVLIAASYAETQAYKSCLDIVQQIDSIEESEEEG